MNNDRRRRGRGECKNIRWTPEIMISTRFKIRNKIKVRLCLALIDEQNIPAPAITALF